MNARDAQRRFDRAAETFDSADFVHARTRQGLFDRLEPMTVKVRTVVDLGSATGASAQLLRQRFRGAAVIAVDISMPMLERSARRRSWFARRPAVQADGRQLPFANHSVDLVFSNLLLPWVDERETVWELDLPTASATFVGLPPRPTDERFTERDLVLSRANKSVRLFAHVADSLAQTRRPATLATSSTESPMIQTNEMCGCAE
mgnify:CR=1 FL=1